MRAFGFRAWGLGVDGLGLALGLGVEGCSSLSLGLSFFGGGDLIRLGVPIRIPSIPHL